MPKTIDNDLAVTDCCPGFGSAAKYTAVSVREAALDVAAMAETSTKVFVYEAMGRHAGWLAAAAGLAGEGRDEAPHLILFPERPFDEARFPRRASKRWSKRVGYCVVVASEGIRTAGRHASSPMPAAARMRSAMRSSAAWPRSSPGGSRTRSAMKVHWTLPDYLQRSARHLASKTDLDQALAVGRPRCEYALAGQNAVMPVIVRTSDAPYRWQDRRRPRSTQVANHEKTMPASFIRKDGYGITAAARRYLEPLIAGEAYPPYARDGLPDYVVLPQATLRRKLPAWAG